MQLLSLDNFFIMIAESPPIPLPPFPGIFTAFDCRQVIKAHQKKKKEKKNLIKNQMKIWRRRGQDKEENVDIYRNIQI